MNTEIPKLTEQVRLTKTGKIDMRGKGRHAVPSRNHPWRSTFVESPQGYQRALKNGFVPRKV